MLQVLVDVNWRPVFFDNKEDAREKIIPYVNQADILKMSDEEAEFLYDIPREEALRNPAKASPIPALILESLPSASSQGGEMLFFSLHLVTQLDLDVFQLPKTEQSEQCIPPKP